MRVVETDRALSIRNCTVAFRFVLISQKSEHWVDGGIVTGIWIEHSKEAPSEEDNSSNGVSSDKTAELLVRTRFWEAMNRED